MNFDEYWSDGFNSYGDARDAAKDAWQEQQAKIDILQIKLNGADERAAAVLNHKNKMIDELQARIDVYEKHVKAIKHIHETQFNKNTDASFILGNLDGFIEYLESDLKGAKDETGLN